MVQEISCDVQAPIHSSREKNVEKIILILIIMYSGWFCLCYFMFRPVEVFGIENEFIILNSKKTILLQKLIVRYVVINFIEPFILIKHVNYTLNLLRRRKKIIPWPLSLSPRMKIILSSPLLMKQPLLWTGRIFSTELDWVPLQTPESIYEKPSNDQLVATMKLMGYDDLNPNLKLQEDEISCCLAL